MPHVSPISPATHPRRRRNKPAGGTLVPLPVPPLQSASLGPISRAGGDWLVDWTRTRADAARVLSTIDFTKRDIVVWIPGTSRRGVHPEFREAMQAAHTTSTLSLTALSYPASWDLRRSVPTGLATMKLVMMEIARRAGGHRVYLAGESQGAWIAGELAADPQVGSLVRRAVLIGHPWLAAHQYAAGEDERVHVINNAGDHVTLPINGDAGFGMDALAGMRLLHLWRAGDFVRALLTNPAHGRAILRTALHSLPIVSALVRDPHDYRAQMGQAVECLNIERAAAGSF